MVTEVTNDVAKNRTDRGGRNSGHEIAITALVRHADYPSYKAALERYEATGLRGLVKRLRRIKPIDRWLNRIVPSTSSSAKMVIGNNPAPAVLVYMSRKISKIENWWGV